MARLLRFIGAAIPMLLASCGLPRDPEKTSERVASTHELRVGVSDNPPWTITNGAEPTGIEPDLIRRFASSIGAHVLWTRASETQLVQALKEGQLDVVAAGLEKKTQWSTTAGASQPYGEDGQGKKHILLAAPGENRFILTLDTFLTEQMRASKRHQA
jgi:ABC-type amino acid transport substrate-binding protein